MALEALSLRPVGWKGKLRGMVANAARSWPAAPRCAAAALVLALCAGALAAGGARAQDGPPAKTFLGVPVAPVTGSYLALKDVNIRALPKTASKRLGSLRKGTRVDAAGRPKDAAWVAVKRDGKALGFVYEAYLLPLIDGALAADIRGQAAGVGVACAYVIRFEGKSAVQGEAFESADYEVDLVCDRGGETIRFTVFMFMPEAPYQAVRDPAWQITVDVRDLGDCCESAFSTVVMYAPRRRRVVFDAVSAPHFGAAPRTRARPAGSVPEALSGTLELALAAWSARLWEAAAEAHR